MRSLTLTFVALLACCWTGAAEAEQTLATGRQKVDVSKLGPQVGQRVPDFSLPDQTGRTRNLQSIMGTRGAMLVFFRSADW
jgi:cytochrome oxidase Cu insertion factor (SCO1/SenC/PrrC family)